MKTVARAARARPGRRDLPGGHAHPLGLARASPSAASGGSRSRAARPWCRSRSPDPSTRATAGRSSRSACTCGSAPALTYPRVENPSPFLAGEVTERIWPCVGLQWEWLGGLPPLRTAAVVGGGSMGTAISSVLARAGLEVQLGCRTTSQAARLLDDRENSAYMPGVALDGGDRAQDRARDRVRAASTWSCSPCPAAACPPRSARSARASATAAPCWSRPRASCRRSAPRRPPTSPSG